jgi:competence protein ComEC
VPENRFAFIRIPFLPLVAAFAAGIAAQNYFSFSLTDIAIVAGCVFALYLAILPLPRHLQFQLRYVRGGLLLLLLALLGCCRFYNNDVANNKLFIGNLPQSQAYLVNIKEPLSPKPKSWKTVASIEKILENGKWQSARGTVFLYIRKDSLLPNIQSGNQLIFTKPLQPIRNMGNPGEFDYAAYCHRNGIYYQLFLNKEDFALLPERRIGFLQKSLNATRKWIIEKIDENITSHEEASVAKALLIGYRGDMDKDTLQSFVNAGVVHIIAMGGMHLIMLAGLFIWLLAPIKRFRNGNSIHALLIIAVIWLFAFIAGAIPSVVRAAIMLSVYSFAGVLGRKYLVYNALAFSALILLAINPYTLWDAGFLLSYSAVLSIAFFYKMIFAKIKVQNKILKYFWGIIVMTASVQILSLPFMLILFHQFPVWSLLANVIAVPLSFVILYATVIMILLSPIPFLSSFVGKFTTAVIWLLDQIIRFVNRLPLRIIDGVSITTMQAGLLLAAIIAIYFFIKTKEKIAMLITAACLLCFVAIGVSQHFKTTNQEEIIVYNIPRHTVIDFVKGTSCVSFSDTVFNSASDEYRNTLKPARDFFQVNMQNNLPELKTAFPKFQLNKKTIFLLSNKTINSLNFTDKIDAFILSNGVYIGFPQMKTHFPNAVYVFDNTNKFWKIAQWKKSCDSLHLRYHSIQEQGAFVLDTKN